MLYNRLLRLLAFYILEKLSLNLYLLGLFYLVALGKSLKLPTKANNPKIVLNNIINIVILYWFFNGVSFGEHYIGSLGTDSI